jgi:hypothetical protein
VPRAYVTRHGWIRASGGAGPRAASEDSSDGRSYSGGALVGLTVALAIYAVVAVVVLTALAPVVAVWLLWVLVSASWRVWRTPAGQRPSWGSVVSSELAAVSRRLSKGWR